MKVTDVQIKQKGKLEGKTKAFVSATFEGVLTVHDIKVVEGQNGLFVSYPSRKANINGEEKYLSTVFIAKEAKESVDKAILDAYEAA